METDWAVGEVMAALEKADIAVTVRMCPRPANDIPMKIALNSFDAPLLAGVTCL